MVTLRFVFNQDKLEQAGKTEDEMLAPMREHAKKYEIAEPEPGFFAKDGENALCVFTMYVIDKTKQDKSYMDYIDNWILDVDGEKEDCKKELQDWDREHERRYVG